MYHYAVKKMYPECKHVMVTIYFIRAGGPFTIHFTDDDLALTEKMIQYKFEFIRDTFQPALCEPKSRWKCSRFCKFGKESFDGTHIEPLTEKRKVKAPLEDGCMTMCEQTKLFIQQYGIDWVTAHMSNRK